MPKIAIDYSHTLMYKICCKDPTITDIYVGHTTNKTQRKKDHKSRCENEKSRHYDTYLYQFIRNNGGWNNWEFIVLEEISCENVHQAKLRERYWLETLGASLNKQVPSRTKQEYNEQHREQIKEYHKQYQEQNKEIIQENRNKKIICECGVEYNKSNQARHHKSKNHLEMIK
jgi:hypothetical protein